MIFWLFWWLCRRKCNLSCDFNESECSRFLKVGMFSQLSQLRTKYLKYLLCHTTLNTSLYLWRLSWIHYPKTNNFFTIIIENKERKKKDTHTITHKQGFLEVLYFFLVGYAIFPVWREIHRFKILPVTLWQLTYRTVSDISCRSQHQHMSIIFSRNSTSSLSRSLGR